MDIDLFTASIRRMTEGNIFSLFSPILQSILMGGGYPNPSHLGIPPSFPSGVPPFFPTGEWTGTGLDWVTLQGDRAVERALSVRGFSV